MTDTTEVRLQKYMDAVRYRLFRPEIRNVFPQIPDRGRRLFALQRFVAALRDPSRGQTWIDSRWAMTDAEFQEWRDSPEFAIQSRELRAIRTRFERANAPNRLRAGSRFRSLAAQIDNWNDNGPVGTHGPRILRRAEREISNETNYPDLGNYLHEPSGLLSHSAMPGGVGIPGAALGLLTAPVPGMAPVVAAANEAAERNAGIERFVTWLASQRTGGPSPTVATPGLSNHGVGQAIDFVIVNGAGDRVLGASNPGAWRDPPDNWARRLADAVRPSTHFTGPLRVPDEPWHWTFDPTP